MESMYERQKEIRKQVVAMLNVEPEINYEDAEIIIKTESLDFPYIRLTISAMNKERGEERIIELCNKSRYLSEKRMHRFIYKMMREAH